MQNPVSLPSSFTFTEIKQPAITCLKLTTETTEQGVQYVQRWQ